MRKLTTIALILIAIFTQAQDVPESNAQPFYGTRYFVSFDGQDTLSFSFQGDSAAWISGQSTNRWYISDTLFAPDYYGLWKGLDTNNMVNDPTDELQDLSGFNSQSGGIRFINIDIEGGSGAQVLDFYEDDDADPTNELQNVSDSLGMPNLTDGYLPNYDEVLNELEDSPIFTDGTDVGIGTTDNKAKLSLYSDAGEMIHVSSEDDTLGMYMGSGLYGNDLGIAYNNKDDKLISTYWQHQPNGYDYVFLGNNHLTVRQSSGNVGIGTTEPGMLDYIDRILSIKGDQSAGVEIRGARDTDGVVGAISFQNDSSESVDKQVANITAKAGRGDSGELNFSVWDGANDSTIALNIGFEGYATFSSTVSAGEDATLDRELVRYGQLPDFSQYVIDEEDPIYSGDSANIVWFSDLDYFTNADETDPVYSGDPASSIIDAGSGEVITSVERIKLNGIEDGAEVNVNADWNATTGDAEILNKPSDITDLSLYSTSDLAEGSNFYFTELRAQSAINSDADHGSTASHNYFTNANEADPVVGAVNGIVKADGAGNISAAVDGTDYNTQDLEDVLNQGNNGGTNDMILDGKLTLGQSSLSNSAGLFLENESSFYVAVFSGGGNPGNARKGSLFATDVSGLTLGSVGTSYSTAPEIQGYFNIAQGVGEGLLINSNSDKPLELMSGKREDRTNPHIVMLDHIDMHDTLDMNSNPVINVPDPVNSLDPVNLQYFNNNTSDDQNLTIDSTNRVFSITNEDANTIQFEDKYYDNWQLLADGSGNLITEGKDVQFTGGTNVTIDKTTIADGWELTFNSTGETNVQSDWNESNSSSDAFILNKPNIAYNSTIGLEGLDNVGITSPGVTEDGYSVVWDNTSSTYQLTEVSGTGTNNYVNGISFNASDGVLTLNRSGLGDLTEDLDGRYLITETDPIYATDSANIVWFSDLDYFTTGDETDPIYATDSSNIVWFSDLDYFTNADETDPIFNAHLASEITESDTTYWGLDNQQLTIDSTGRVFSITNEDANTIKFQDTDTQLTQGEVNAFETDPIVGAVNGIVKADGAGNISAAIEGTDYTNHAPLTLTSDDIGILSNSGQDLTFVSSNIAKLDASNTFTRIQQISRSAPILRLTETGSVNDWALIVDNDVFSIRENLAGNPRFRILDGGNIQFPTGKVTAGADATNPDDLVRLGQLPIDSVRNVLLSTDTEDNSTAEYTIYEYDVPADEQVAGAVIEMFVYGEFTQTTGNATIKMYVDNVEFGSHPINASDVFRLKLNGIVRSEGASGKWFTSCMSNTELNKNEINDSGEQTVNTTTATKIKVTAQMTSTDDQVDIHQGYTQIK